MMSFRRSGSPARDLFRDVRESVPGVGRAETVLGSRLVVARNVLRLRMQRGMTQAELAAAVGVRQPRIAEIESARANLQLDTLDQLAAAFGIRPARLLREDSRADRAGVTRAAS